MDIRILLTLQQFREGSGGILLKFLEKMTFLGEMNTVLVIIALVYWCVSKEFGTYLLMGWGGNRLVNGVLKVTACVYRPWIRDPQIIPNANAMSTATGYSFPSGHSMNAASVYGGAASRNDLPRVVRISCGITVALVAFSRLFLGVHTPQDVLIGVSFGLLVMLLVFYLMRWLDSHPEKDVLVAGIGVLLAVLISIYAALKPYPTDFDAQGRLLVDGAKMAKDTFKGTGWFMAFLSGWILERRFVRFTTEIPMPGRAARLTVGLLSYYAVSLIAVPLIADAVPGPAGTLVSCYLQMFFIVFLFPLLIRIVESEIMEPV